MSNDDNHPFFATPNSRRLLGVCALVGALALPSVVTASTKGGSAHHAARGWALRD